MLPPVMAVSGPPDGGELDLQLSLTQDHPFPPLGGKSPTYPGPPSPSRSPEPPGPASPGKKRVRISDSTPSVRVIEDTPLRPPGAPRAPFQQRSYYHQFNSDYIRKMKAEASPQLTTAPPKEGEGRWQGEDDVPWEYAVENGVEYLQEIQEYARSEGHLEACAEDVSSTVVQSLESRDNPFLPGGDLSREAEDLLSKATIVRDKFYLNQQHPSSKAAASAVDPNFKPSAGSRHKDVTDGAVPNDSKHPHSSPVAEERVTASAAARAEACAQPPHSRENGKASDGVGCSPDGVKLEVGAEGDSDSGQEEGQDKDRAKRRPNKCCAIM